MEVSERAHNPSPPARFDVRFWGVRGSIAAPGADTARYGGNTTCISVRCDDHLIVLDAGTGARALGDELIAAHGPSDAIVVSFLFSHTHTDHIGGFPFFAPLYREGTHIAMYGDGTRPVGTRGSLERMMSYPLFPVELGAAPAHLVFHDVEPGATFAVGPARVRTCRLNHPGGALAFRIEHRDRVYVHASDVEHVGPAPAPDLLALCEGADVLSYDAMFVEGVDFEAHVGWGHSTWQAGVRLCRAAGVGRFVATHHAPEHDDAWMDAIGRDLAAALPGSLVAAEGMTIDLLSGSVAPR